MSTTEPDFKWMLDNLLARIHRDGGQYTVLAGYRVSFEDADKIIANLYVENAELKARLNPKKRWNRMR